MITSYVTPHAPSVRNLSILLFPSVLVYLCGCIKIMQCTIGWIYLQHIRIPAYLSSSDIYLPAANLHLLLIFPPSRSGITADTNVR
ncbi:hypothetical protein F4823DRAFT_587077 [Ustulina deusta]|nr:hypothetical protein F4823DRAFT_587077 [Ustulina deusta]